MKKIALMWLFLMFICSNAYAEPVIKAKSAILASADNNQILYEKNPEERVYPAGLTKLFTALVAYESCGMEQIVTVPENISDYLTPLEPSMKLKPGEEITTGDLIYAMVVGSANDASIALAIYCGGSVDDFVVKMNEKAKALNLTSTNFVNATGNHDENQFTTARDMLKIYSEIYKMEPLIKVLNTRNANIPSTNLSPKRTFWTGNHLISRYIETKYIYDKAVGGKAASSSAGGYSIAANGKKAGVQLIAIVFNSTLDAGVNYSFVDAQNMFDYGFDNYVLKTIVKQDELICERKVKNSRDSEHLLLYSGKPLKGLILNNDTTESIQKQVNVPAEISAPIKKGETKGNVEYSYNGRFIGSVALVAGADVNFNIIKYIGNSILWFLNLKIVKAILFIIIASILIYAVVVIIAVKKQTEKKKQKK